jgi:protein subunit release factor A
VPRRSFAARGVSRARSHLPAILALTLPNVLQNRETAWTILRGKVHAHRAKLAEEANRVVRASQIPGMDRADKIRTWNEPQVRPPPSTA